MSKTLAKHIENLTTSLMNFIEAARRVVHADELLRRPAETKGRARTPLRRDPDQTKVAQQTRRVQFQERTSYPRGRSAKLAKAGMLPAIFPPDGEIRFDPDAIKIRQPEAKLGKP